MENKLDKQLETLTKTWEEKIAVELDALEEKLTDELIEQMTLMTQDEDIKQGAIEEVAAVFVNGAMIAHSIWSDPTGDWQGEPVVKNLADCLDWELDDDEEDEDIDIEDEDD